MLVPYEPPGSIFRIAPCILTEIPRLRFTVPKVLVGNVGFSTTIPVLMDTILHDPKCRNPIGEA